VKPSDEKINALVYGAVKALERDKTVRVLDRDTAIRSLRAAVEQVIELDEAIEAAAEAKIRSLSRRVTPGTREWSELLARYIAEERQKRGL
jgi:hypothetical protein